MLRDSLTGVTSNPTIFGQAIGGSTDYDDALRAWRTPARVYSVRVGAELPVVHGRSGAEERDGSFGVHEPVPPQRHEFADGNAVAGYDETLAFVESTHDLSALVAQLPLSDFSAHAASVAPRATPCKGAWASGEGNVNTG